MIFFNMYPELTRSIAHLLVLLNILNKKKY